MRRLIFGVGLVVLLLWAILSSTGSVSAAGTNKFPTPAPVPTSGPKIKIAAVAKTIKANVDLGDICWGRVIKVSSKETFYNQMVRFTSSRKGVELTNAYCVSDAWRWIVQQWLRLTTGRFWTMVSY